MVYKPRINQTERPKIGKYKPKRELAELIIEYFIREVI